MRHRVECFDRLSVRGSRVRISSTVDHQDPHLGYDGDRALFRRRVEELSVVLLEIEFGHVGSARLPGRQLGHQLHDRVARGGFVEAVGPGEFDLHPDRELLPPESSAHRVLPAGSAEPLCVRVRQFRNWQIRTGLDSKGVGRSLEECWPAIQFAGPAWSVDHSGSGDMRPAPAQRMCGVVGSDRSCVSLVPGWEEASGSTRHDVSRPTLIAARFGYGSSGPHRGRIGGQDVRNGATRRETKTQAQYGFRSFRLGSQDSLNRPRKPVLYPLSYEGGKRKLNAEACQAISTCRAYVSGEVVELAESHTVTLSSNGPNPIPPLHGTHTVCRRSSTCVEIPSSVPTRTPTSIGIGCSITSS